MIIYFILPALMMIPIGIYIYFYIKRALKFFGKDITKRWQKNILIIITILIALQGINTFSTGAMILLHIVIIALLLEVIRFIVKIARKNKEPLNNIFSKVYSSGLLPIVLSAIIITYGFVNMGNIVETDYTVKTDKAIGKQNYKIALISDLHFGTTMTEEKLKKVVDQISKKNADLVVLDGDIVDESTTNSQMKNCFKILSKINNKNGILYVYGNHDRATYSSTPYFSIKELDEAITSNNIKIMNDNTLKINEELVVLGRNDKGYLQKDTRKTTKELMSGISNNSFTLLLDHQPNGLEDNAKAGVDLMLSGHTHGGQIWPVGLMIDVLQFGELNYGEKKDGNFTAIVTSGIAGWGYAIRTGHHSEFAIINIKSK